MGFVENILSYQLRMNKSVEINQRPKVFTEIAPKTRKMVKFSSFMTYLLVFHFFGWKTLKAPLLVWEPWGELSSPIMCSWWRSERCHRPSHSLTNSLQMWMTATVVCSGWNDLLDHLHPGLHPVRLRGVSRGPAGPQPGHDHAAHLARLGRRQCRHHAGQRRQREGSREEVQLLWQEKVELWFERKERNHRVPEGHIFRTFLRPKNQRKKIFWMIFWGGGLNRVRRARRRQWKAAKESFCSTVGGWNQKEFFFLSFALISSASFYPSCACFFFRLTFFWNRVEATCRAMTESSQMDVVWPLLLLLPHQFIIPFSPSCPPPPQSVSFRSRYWCY